MIPFVSAMPGIISSPEDESINSLTFERVGGQYLPGNHVTVTQSVLAGDLLFFDDVANSPSTSVTPTGFTTISSTAFGNVGLGNSMRRTWSYKIATGSESGTTIVGMSVSGFYSFKNLIRFRPNRPIVSATFGTTSSSGTGGNPGAVGVTVASFTEPVIIFGGWAKLSGNFNTVSWTPGSPDGAWSIGSSTASRLALKVYLSDPANTSVDMGDAGDYNINWINYARLF